MVIDSAISLMYKVIFTFIGVIKTFFSSIYCLYWMHGNDADRYWRESRAEYCA